MQLNALKYISIMYKIHNYKFEQVFCESALAQSFVLKYINIKFLIKGVHSVKLQG